MSYVPHTFDAHTEEYAASTLRRIREFAQNTPLDGPLAIEVGTNRGRFLAGVASRDSDIQHLGIEIRRKYAVQAQKRLVREEIPNATVICADANLVIPIIAKPQQIRTFYLVCPDPWWKTRHEKRRVINPAFLDILSDRMEDLARLYIRTDVSMLAEAMHDHLSEHPDFMPLKPQDYPTESFPLSTRERHVISYGMPLFPLYYQRAPREL